jgi:hypothetical protein
VEDLACVAHVHSTCSDGTATVPEIAAAARAAGADAVLLTDHDTLAARRAGFEGFHDGVLVLVGMEISPRGGHFLAFGLDEEVAHEGRTEEEICAEVSARGALGFAAHPFSTGSAISKTIGRPHPWGSLETCAMTGIELWSAVTEGAERCASLRELAAFLRRPEDAIDRIPAANLERWDRLCARRRVVAIGGLDAHQSGFRIRGRVFSPHPHERLFRTLRTHVLIYGEPGASAIYDALREGRCYLAVDSLRPARGFRFWADGERGELAMGQETEAGTWWLRARLPAPADVRLVRDGRVVEQSRSDSVDFAATGPGVFRVEAEIDGLTWIVSNPIYLR